MSAFMSSCVCVWEREREGERERSGSTTFIVKDYFLPSLFLSSSSRSLVSPVLLLFFYRRWRRSIVFPITCITVISSIPLPRLFLPFLPLSLSLSLSTTAPCTQNITILILILSFSPCFFTNSLFVFRLSSLSIFLPIFFLHSLTSFLFYLSSSLPWLSSLPPSFLPSFLQMGYRTYWQVLERKCATCRAGWVQAPQAAHSTPWLIRLRKYYIIQCNTA